MGWSPSAVSSRVVNANQLKGVTDDDILTSLTRLGTAGTMKMLEPQFFLIH